MIEFKNLGVDLALAGTIISASGVLALNAFLNPFLAMQLWAFSNPILTIYFYGDYRKWWAGKLGSGLMTVLYLVFTVTGFYGLWRYTNP